jgi:hypothetical protein
MPLGLVFESSEPLLVPGDLLGETAEAPEEEQQPDQGKER